MSNDDNDHDDEDEDEEGFDDDEDDYNITTVSLWPHNTIMIRFEDDNDCWSWTLNIDGTWISLGNIKTGINSFPQ